MLGIERDGERQTTPFSSFVSYWLECLASGAPIYEGFQSF